MLVAIVETIRDKGVHPEVAAEACGLPRSEFFAWKRDVEAGIAHSAVVEFFDAIARGEATWEVGIVGDIGADASPEQKMKLLERRKPKNWSQQITVALDSELGAVIGKLAALKSIDRQMTGNEAYIEVLKLISKDG